MESDFIFIKSATKAFRACGIVEGIKLNFNLYNGIFVLIILTAYSANDSWSDWFMALWVIGFFFILAPLFLFFYWWLSQEIKIDEYSFLVRVSEKNENLRHDLYWLLEDENRVSRADFSGLLYMNGYLNHVTG